MHSSVVIIILIECEIREKKRCATQCNELRGKEEKRRRSEEIAGCSHLIMKNAATA